MIIIDKVWKKLLLKNIENITSYDYNQIFTNGSNFGIE